MKDYYACLGFVENILHNDKDYDAMKLKYMCYQRLNYQKEADEMAMEMYNFMEERGQCDMSMRDKFKEIALKLNQEEERRTKKMNF